MCARNASAVRFVRCAEQVSVLGCLRNLCEDLDARRMVSKAIRSERLRADGTSTGKREKLGVFLLSLLSPSAMARADACLMLKLLMTKVEGDKEVSRPNPPALPSPPPIILLREGTSVCLFRQLRLR